MPWVMPGLSSAVGEASSLCIVMKRQGVHRGVPVPEMPEKLMRKRWLGVALVMQRGMSAVAGKPPWVTGDALQHVRGRRLTPMQPGRSATAVVSSHKALAG